MSDTYCYKDAKNRQIAAHTIYDRFCDGLKSDPERAKMQLISRIQSALGQAYAQGVNADE